MRNLLLQLACLFVVGCTTAPVYKEVASPAPLPPVRAYEKDTDLAEAMRQAIRRHFVSPPGNFSATVEVTLDLVVFSDGAVVDVQISRSSGDEGLDRAVVRAVRLAQPLPILKEPLKGPTREPTKERTVLPKSQKYRLAFRPFAPAAK